MRDRRRGQCVWDREHEGVGWECWDGGTWDMERTHGNGMWGQVVVGTGGHGHRGEGGQQGMGQGHGGDRDVGQGDGDTGAEGGVQVPGR